MSRHSDRKHDSLRGYAAFTLISMLPMPFFLALALPLFSMLILLSFITYYLAL